MEKTFPAPFLQAAAQLSDLCCSRQEPGGELVQVCWEMQHPSYNVAASDESGPAMLIRRAGAFVHRSPRLQRHIRTRASPPGHL